MDTALKLFRTAILGTAHPLIATKTPNTFTVTAADIDLRTPLTGAEIYYGNTMIGTANIPITYAFHKVKRRTIRHETGSNHKPHRVIDYNYVYLPIVIKKAGYINATIFIN